jgi:hypothetical protein
MSKADIADAIIDTAEAMGQTMSPGAITVYLAALSGIPEEAIKAALVQCAMNLKGRLTPQEIIARIEDGRPGAQEAWGMMPTSEDQTIVWTGEMSGAWAAAAPLMNRDKIAARQTFLEVYQKLVMNARNERRPARWTASLGTDQHQKETALREAVEQGKMTLERARHFLPFGNFVEQTPQLGSDTQDQKLITEET